jgi:hypothetical protein
LHSWQVLTFMPSKWSILEDRGMKSFTNSFLSFGNLMAAIERNV